MKAATKEEMLIAVVSIACHFGHDSNFCGIVGSESGRYGWRYTGPFFGTLSDHFSLTNETGGAINDEEVKAGVSALQLLVNGRLSEYFDLLNGALVIGCHRPSVWQKEAGALIERLLTVEASSKKARDLVLSAMSSRTREEWMRACEKGPSASEWEKTSSKYEKFETSTAKLFGSVGGNWKAKSSAPDPDKALPSKGMIFARSECEADFIERFADSLTAVANNVCYCANEINLASSNIGASMIGLRHIQQICHAQQRRNGWWEKDANGRLVDRNHAEVLALIISEVTEALEGDRKGLEDPHVAGRKNVEVELADAVCRIFDAAQAWGLDIAGALTDKLAYNACRSDHKIENRKKEGGKKY